MKAYRVRGTTNDVTDCEQCGRIELRGTVMMQPLDAEGNDDGDVSYFGTSCAAKAAGWTQRDVKARVKTANEINRAHGEALRMEHDMRFDAIQEAWYMEHYGVRTVIEAAKVSGLSGVAVSSLMFEGTRELRDALPPRY